MRHAALLVAVWGLLLSSCSFPTMSLDALACNADHACVDGYVCHEGQCMRPLEVPPQTACEAALLDKPCSVGQGTCSRTGVTACVSGVVQCSVSAGSSSAEVCDGQDNDCDGQADEDLTVPTCELSKGVCADSRPTCQGTAGWSACTYPSSYEQNETSCDGLDNDCDGVVDDVPGCMQTIAGDGPPGFRDGPAASARFSAGKYITRDAQGRIFVADYSNHAIRRIDPDGTVTTMAGTGRSGMEDGPVATAKLNQPYDVEVAADGTIYFSDFANDRVRTIRDGIVTTLVGTTQGNADGDVSVAQLDGPAGITLLPNGDLLIADKNNHRIRRYLAASKSVVTVAGTSSGTTEGVRTGQTGTQLQLKAPGDVVEDGQGNLYVSETGSHRIRKIPPTGTSSTLAGLAGTAGNVEGVTTAARFNVPEELLLDEAAGALYVADSNNNRVRLVPLDGTTTTRSVVGAYVSTPGLRNGSSSSVANGARTSSIPGMVRIAGNPPTWLLVDANGVIRSAVEGNSFVNSSIGDFAGGVAAEIGKDGPALEARMRRPLGITRTADGMLYWVEREEGVLRRLTPQGQVETAAGTSSPRAAGYTNGSLSAAQFNNPRDVTAGPDGKLYLVESVNHAVRVVDMAAGTVGTFAGPDTAIADYTDSDTPGNARFNAPRGVAYGRTAAGVDVLYVSDEKNCAVRMVELASRKVTTLAGLGPTGCGFADGPQGVGKLAVPGPIAADLQGNVYVADKRTVVVTGQPDRYEYVVRLIRPDGTLSTIYDHTNSNSSYTGSLIINGLTMDGTGLVVTSDQFIAAVAINGSSITPRALFQTSVSGWQNGMGAEAGAMRLSGVLALPGRLLLTDENSHRLRQLGR